ncbi:hypothetical protein PR202_gb26913 [Eleusine coracana subsp. coracana]|uniref:Uncharacterized protein n=1 Tax=Eleusine coracana subsp. coracana TaxID=191504 RepID=A0AAV5FSY4_ELECO|nr:hypothetical protein PR202_gb26913 [Eleusine coracana subsp. coracana]
MGNRGAGHFHPQHQLQHERHHAGLRRPPRRPRARLRLLRLHRPRWLQLWYHARHGQRPGDAVRAGVRREEVPHDGRVHAAFMDHPLHLHATAAPPLLRRGGRAAADGAATGGGGHGGARGHLVHPSPLLLRLPLPAAAVPAVPAEELGRRHHLCRRALLPRRHHLALLLVASARARQRRAGPQHLVVVDDAHAFRLRHLRRMPGHVAWFLCRGVRRHLGVCQVVLRLWCYVVLGALVLQNTNSSDWKPQRHGCCRRRTHDLRACGQRARRWQREWRKVCSDRVVDDLAVDRDLFLRVDHILPRQDCTRLHHQRCSAERL